MHRKIGTAHISCHIWTILLATCPCRVFGRILLHSSYQILPQAYILMLHLNSLYRQSVTFANINCYVLFATFQNVVSSVSQTTSFSHKIVILSRSTYVNWTPRGPIPYVQMAHSLFYIQWYACLIDRQRILDWRATGPLMPGINRGVCRTIYISEIPDDVIITHWRVNKMADILSVPFSYAPYGVDRLQKFNWCNTIANCMFTYTYIEISWFKHDQQP